MHTTIIGVISRMKYVPLLFSRYVASVTTRHAQQIAALSSRRWMVGLVKLRAPAFFIARLFRIIFTMISAVKQDES
jgi:hypothetical protein